MAAEKRPRKRTGEQISGRAADYQAIGAWLRERRVDAHKGQLELNREMGKSNTFMYRVEAGRQRIDLLQFLELARLLQLDRKTTITDLMQALGWDEKTP